MFITNEEVFKIFVNVMHFNNYKYSRVGKPAECV